ncbi:MAG: hypothetical protein NC319_05785, partial [Butyricicoccus sp.]|nr:hypothetical protein [Butyricicoccus sp.]
MRAHTVILGAGATIAAIPNGDKNGKKSSVMSGLIEKLHLEDVLCNIKLQTKSDNLEDIYSELYKRPECNDIIRELEKRLYDYFASLELPDEPTVYDFLVLSLTNKDVIATFNWDPLLIQAYVRCHRLTNNLPHIFCLHGNVAVGYCSEHQEFGTTDAECPICGKVLPPTKLLYPVKDKDYENDDYIKACWNATEYIIENSYMLTIFGYSAPNSDKAAVSLLKKAWGDIEKRQLEEVSVIDIISEEDMMKKWRHFIHSHHYRYTNSFFDSYLGMFPRRSCETVFATFCLNLPANSNAGFRPDMTWGDLEDFLQGLLHDEQVTPIDKNLPLYYTNAIKLTKDYQWKSSRSC